jgi:hypothetical protein
MSDVKVLWQNSHAELWENSHAVLRENSHAVLWQNSHAVLRENSHAELRENSHAVLRENSHAVLYDFAVVHVLGDKCNITVKSPCAVIIPVKWPKSVSQWCRMKGIPVRGGRIQLWKAVARAGTDFYSGQIQYLKQNTEIVAPDWDGGWQHECGHALHLGDSPSGAMFFVSPSVLSNGAFWLLRVSAAVKDCRVFPDLPDYPMKLRARACRVISAHDPVTLEKIDFPKPE